MRISLKVGATTYPLAGQSGVDERVHSSAGDFRISAQSQQELIQRVRAATVKGVDRGNLATTITFSTSRVFATVAEAFLYSLDHDGALPRAGILILETAKPSGAAYSRYLMDVVISPPSRRVTGCSVLLDYTATGGGIVVGPGTDAPVLTISGTFVKSGGGALVFPPLLSAGFNEGYPYYTATGLPYTGTGTEYIVAWSAGAWSISVLINGGAGGIPYIAGSTAGTAATPNLATGWAATVGTGTPTLTLA